MIRTDHKIPAITNLFGSLENRTDIIIQIEYISDSSVDFSGFSKKTDEKYTLKIDNNDNICNIVISCFNDKSAFYAVSDIYYRELVGELNSGTYYCEPAFRKRGYIEGFYGNPWTYSQRLSFLSLMASKRMNTVFYAPKDDEYHRSKWDVLYPADELAGLKALSDDAASYFIDFNWCIAPGLSIRYSDSAHFEKLVSKVKQIYSIGIRGFGLLLDDIDGGLCYEEDINAYSDLTHAHIELITRFYTALKEIDPENHLTICPTVYHGKGTEDYIIRLGNGISKDISIFWTGRDICSRDITTIEAITFLNGTGHMPLYWDNYPVNDCAMKNEMHISAIINRDADLCKFSEGIISNCMEYCESSKIPVMTTADYLWDSYGYSPEKAFETAVKRVFGNDGSDFLVLADFLHTSCLLDSNTVNFCSMFEQSAKLYSKGLTKETSGLILEYSDKISHSSVTVRNHNEISGELNDWLNKYDLIPPILSAFSEYLILKSDNSLEKIKNCISEYNRNPRRLTEDYYFESEFNFVLGKDVL